MRQTRMLFPLLASSLLALPSDAPAQGSHAGVRFFPAESIRPADFDFDGRTDFIEGDVRQSVFAIQYANPDGTLERRVYERSVSMSLGRLDNDPFIDAVYADDVADAFRFVWGNASRDPATTSIPLPDAFVDEMLITDADGDGISDVLYTDAFQRLHILPGLGARSFADPDQLSSSIQAHELIECDADGDGEKEFVAHARVGRLRVFTVLAIKGFGYFAILEGDVELGGFSLDAEAFDHDADGADELFATQGASVLIFDDPLSDPAPPPTFVPFEGDEVMGMMFDDLDRNGIPDIIAVVARRNQPATSVREHRELAVAYGLGGGAYAPGVSLRRFVGNVLGQANEASRLHRADVNRDGSDDVIVENLTQTAVWFPRRADGRVIAPWAHFDPDATILDFAAGDLDADGFDEIVYADQDTGRVAALSSRGGDLREIASFEEPDAIDQNTAVAIADFDADGRGEILRYYFDAVVLYDPDGSPPKRSRIEPAERARGINLFRGRRLHPADLDADGDTDALLLAGARYALINDGTGNFTREQVTFREGQGLRTAPDLPDADDDGAANMVFFESTDSLTPSRPNILLLSYAGEGPLDELGSLTFPNELSSVRQLDVNADGLPDIVAVCVPRPQDSDELPTRIACALNLGGGAYSEPIVSALPVRTPAGEIIDALDLNQDGLTDLLTGVAVLLGDHTGAFTLGTAQPLLVNARSMDGADISRDGFTDIVAVSGSRIYVAPYTGAALNACVGDLTLDAVIDQNDLALLLSRWDTQWIADFNDDGTADATDLATLLANWGACVNARTE